MKWKQEKNGCINVVLLTWMEIHTMGFDFWSCFQQWSGYWCSSCCFKREQRYATHNTHTRTHNNTRQHTHAHTHTHTTTHDNTHTTHDNTRQHTHTQTKAKKCKVYINSVTTFFSDPQPSPTYWHQLQQQPIL